MTKAIARDSIYRRHRFQAEIIELCVRWYISYRLSYRDLVAMMAERGVDVSHTTILRSRAGRTALFVSGCRQARQDGGLSALRGSQQGRRAGFLQEGGGHASAQVAAQDNARRQWWECVFRTNLTADSV